MLPVAPRRPLPGRLGWRIGGRHVERPQIAIAIDPEVVDPEDVGMLQDLITAAVNEAIEQSQGLAAQQMGALTGGLDLGSLGGLLG